MKSTTSIRRTVLALTAVLAATASLAQGAPAIVDPQQAMLTIPQAITIAEVTQSGSAYSLKREAVGTDIVYHVKVSTPDRGVVNVHVKAYGGRVAVQSPHRE